MKIVKIILFSIGGLLLLLFTFQFTKVSKTSTTKLKDALSGLLGNSATKGSSLTNSPLLKVLPKVKETKPVVTTPPKEDSSINEYGIDLTSYLGMFTINGTNFVPLYRIKDGVAISVGFGFTNDGAIVYQEILNEGTPEEYEVYHT